MKPNQKVQIKTLFEDVKTAMKAVYMQEAIDMEKLATKELMQQMKRIGYEWDISRVKTTILSDYAIGLGNGGTMCIEQIVTPLGNGLAEVESKQKFISWLDDFATKTSDDIINKIGTMQSEGYHPKEIARALKDDFEGTRHNCMTSARTECSKLRNDVRSQRFIEQGVEYVKWITVGDSKVRETHRLRHGKIYRHSDAPYIGEYNCRCALAPADYDVEIDGEAVEPSGAIVVPESAINR